jgi:hypothetical protein
LRSNPQYAFSPATALDEHEISERLSDTGPGVTDMDLLDGGEVAPSRPTNRETAFTPSKSAKVGTKETLKVLDVKFKVTTVDRGSPRFKASTEISGVIHGSPKAAPEGRSS